MLNSVHALGTDQKTGTILDVSKRRNLIEELFSEVLEAHKKPKWTSKVTQKVVTVRNHCCPGLKEWKHSQKLWL